MKTSTLILRNRLIAYVVGGLAEITESRDWEQRRKALLDPIGSDAAHVIGGLGVRLRNAIGLLGCGM